MINYEVITNEEYNDTQIKRTNEDGSVSWIPINETNSDYQRYLRWLENPDAEEGGAL